MSDPRQQQEQEHLAAILEVLQRVRCGTTDGNDAAFLASELAVTQIEKTLLQETNHDN